MKTLVVYYSKTGFTQRYANWLKEDLGCDCVPLGGAAPDFSQYDAVAFGSSVHAGRIRKLAWFQKQLPRLARKRVALFFTGAMPPEPNTVAQCVAQNLTYQEQKQVRTFYLWGGLNYQAMGPVDRWMMGVFRKMLAAKKDPSPEDQMAAKMVASSYDKTDRASLQPLERYLLGKEGPENA